MQKTVLVVSLILGAALLTALSLVPQKPHQLLSEDKAAAFKAFSAWVAETGRHYREDEVKFG